jgi:WD40 repeat protein
VLAPAADGAVHFGGVSGTAQRERAAVKVEDPDVAALSPDGKTVACRAGEGALPLWDLGKPPAAARGALQGPRLPGWAGVMRDLAYSADGQRLVSCGQDGRVIVWAAAAGTNLTESNRTRRAAEEVHHAAADGPQR